MVGGVLEARASASLDGPRAKRRGRTAFLRGLKASACPRYRELRNRLVTVGTPYTCDRPCGTARVEGDELLRTAQHAREPGAQRD